VVSLQLWLTSFYTSASSAGAVAVCLRWQSYEKGGQVSRSTSILCIPTGYSGDTGTLQYIGNGIQILVDLGHRITIVSGEAREGHFLFQRMSITLQHHL